jgi:hypothetical protein
MVLFLRIEGEGGARGWEAGRRVEVMERRVTVWGVL